MNKYQFELVKCLRCGRESRAHELMIQYVSDLENALSAESFPDPEKRLWILEATDAQRRGDWLYLADVIEYKLR